MAEFDIQNGVLVRYMEDDKHVIIPEGVTNVTKFLNIDTDDNNIIISNRNTGKKVVVFDILVQYMENDSSIRIYSIYHNNESFECTVEKNLKMKID